MLQVPWQNNQNFFEKWEFLSRSIPRPRRGSRTIFSLRPRNVHLNDIGAIFVAYVSHILQYEQPEYCVMQHVSSEHDKFDF